MNLVSKYRIALVNYTNTTPFRKALESGELSERITLIPAIPADCVKLFNDRKVDIALIPIGAFPSLKAFNLITRFGIACDGAVRTVKLLSNQPLESVDTIYLDHHSRSSAQLVRILCENYWNIYPQFKTVDLSKQQGISNKTILAIGDKVIQYENDYQFHFDLGTAWKAWQGLPFVFASWVCDQQVDPEFIELMGNHFEIQLNQLEKHENHQITSKGWVEGYFTKYIKYKLNNEHKQAIKKYLSFLDYHSPDLFKSELVTSN